MLTTLARPGFYTRRQVGDAVVPWYRENGFLVVTDGVDDAGLQALARETVALCRGERGAVHRSPHAVGGELTDEQMRTLPEAELLPRFLCIHHPHKISETIHQYLAHPAIVEVLTRIIGPNVKCMQSMLFTKAAGKPGQAWHQDEDYIPTRDRSLTGAWIAIDDATVENGCLWVIPGSHRPGILWPQYLHRNKEYDCAGMSYDFPYDEQRDAIPVEVPRGSIVFFNGYLLHKSLRNRAPQGTFRRVLVNHYMSAESLLPWWPQEQTAIAKTDVRDVVMVAGTDPYAWKGYDDIAKPSVRAAGEGGCGDNRVDLETHRQAPLAQRRRM